MAFGAPVDGIAVALIVPKNLTSAANPGRAHMSFAFRVVLRALALTTITAVSSHAARGRLCRPYRRQRRRKCDASSRRTAGRTAESHRPRHHAHDTTVQRPIRRALHHARESAKTFRMTYETQVGDNSTW